MAAHRRLRLEVGAGRIAVVQAAVKIEHHAPAGVVRSLAALQQLLGQCVVAAEQARVLVAQRDVATPEAKRPAYRASA